MLDGIQKLRKDSTPQVYQALSKRDAPMDSRDLIAQQPRAQSQKQRSAVLPRPTSAGGIR